MKILITGANGMVAGATIEHCRKLGDTVAAFARGEFDIADKAAAFAILEREKPDSVINCAAFTNVDLCESEDEKNFAANARGVENLALACRNVNANLVTISTDYVFDGAKDGFYTQRDEPVPQSRYGRAKLAGERLAAAALARTTIVRSGWIFGADGKNFLSSVVEKLLQGERVKAISDAYGTPTYAPHLAERLRELAELDLPGIYHVTNSGSGTSYAGFARAAAEDENLVEDLSSAVLNRPAPRPVSSKLFCLLSEAINLKPLPAWETALQNYIEAIRVNR